MFWFIKIKRLYLMWIWRYEWMTRGSISTHYSLTNTWQSLKTFSSSWRVIFRSKTRNDTNSGKDKLRIINIIHYWLIVRVPLSKSVNDYDYIVFSVFIICSWSFLEERRINSCKFELIFSKEIIFLNFGQNNFSTI